MKILLKKFFSIFGINIFPMSKIKISQDKETLQIAEWTLRVSAIEGAGRANEIINGIGMKSGLKLLFHSTTIFIPYDDKSDRDKDFEILDKVIKGNYSTSPVKIVQGKSE
jgi:hypothetical protein